MNANELPLNKIVTITDENYIHVSANRINENELVTTWVNPENNIEVLRVKAKVETGEAEIESLDTSFWEIKIDGEVTDSDEFETFEAYSVTFNANPKDRKLEIRTY